MAENAQHTPTPADVAARHGVQAPQAAQEAHEGHQEAQEAAQDAQGTDWRARARLWESRAKANADAATRLQELEDAQKSEAQRLTERAERAEGELTAARAEALRSRVLADHGIPSSLSHLVTGADEDALVAAAESVQSLMSQAAPAPQEATTARYVLPAAGKAPETAVPLNSDALEDTIRAALNRR